MEMPGDADDWRLIGVNYEHVWNFPHCVRAMDGKHVLIQAPDNSGTQFFNYKGTFSVVLRICWKRIRIAVGALGDLSKDIRIESTECRVNCESNLRVAQLYPAHIHTSCYISTATGSGSKAAWRCPKSWSNGQQSSRWCHCSAWKARPILRYNGGRCMAGSLCSNGRGRVKYYFETWIFNSLRPSDAYLRQ